MTISTRCLRSPYPHSPFSFMNFVTALPPNSTNPLSVHQLKTLSWIGWPTMPQLVSLALWALSIALVYSGIAVLVSIETGL